MTKLLRVYASIAFGGARGGGHLARVSYYLAQLARHTPIEVTFVVDNESAALLHTRAYISLPGVSTTQPISTQQLASKKANGKDAGVDLLIIDRCLLNLDLLKFASRSFKVLVISDSTDNPYIRVADILVDINHGSERLELLYREQAPVECIYLLGWEYAPIQPCPIELAKDLQARRLRLLAPPWHMLLTMGSEDPLGFTEIALEALVGSRLAQDLAKLTVIKGPLYNREIANSYSLPMEIVESPKNLNQYYAEADLCISTGGVSTWERLRAGLPSRVVAYSKLQKKILMTLHEMGLLQIFSTFEALCSESLNPDRHIKEMDLMCNITLGTKCEDVIYSIIEP